MCLRRGQRGSLSGQEVQYLFPALQRRRGADRRGADRPAGIAETERLLRDAAAQKLTGEARDEVVPRPGGVHRADLTGRKGEAPLRALIIAALRAELHDHVLYAGVQEDPGHLFRRLAAGVIAGFVLVRRNIVDQGQDIRQIRQRQEAEVRQLGVRDHEEALLFRGGQDRADHVRVVKRRPEQRAEDQRAGLPERATTALGMEIMGMRGVRDRPAGSVVAHEHRRHGRRMLRRAQDQRGIHAAAAQRVRHHVPRRVLAEAAEDCGLKAEPGRGHGLVHRLAAHVQASRGRAVPGGRDRLRIKALDDGIHQRHADADEVIVSVHLTRPAHAPPGRDTCRPPPGCRKPPGSGQTAAP